MLYTRHETSEFYCLDPKIFSRDFVCVQAARLDSSELVGNNMPFWYYLLLGAIGTGSAFLAF